ncbi:NlpC/P60 family protein [Dawidia soli]|uniref:C40 family peptidase n=1 Tax=Dawidia soli TaxID=2782352 RepID=A0AAP2GGW0_9BACT|nr:NlpC/P60 family protein [Dawidia soli]MBT1685895.1 C40 family peptidase [Dawidia soli]
MKRIYYAAAIVLLTALMHGCSDSGDDETSIESSEGLDSQEIEILDNTPDAVGFDPEDVVLPNGRNMMEYLEEVNPDFLDEQGRKASPKELGPQAARNELIAKLTYTATRLIDRSRYPGNGQNGLGYSWGSKDPSKLQPPPGAGTKCKEPIYGLDCSGYLYQVFKSAGIILPEGPADLQRDATVLENAIKKAYPEFKKLKVDDLGEIPAAKFETGDIIYWLNSKGQAKHIGVILKDANGRLAVFQSNGSPGTDSGDCDKNMSAGRGPRKLELNDPYWFATNKIYGVVRFNAAISGKWDLVLRCQGYTTDALKFNLDFPTSQEADLSITGSGVDYDGEPINCEGTLHYDNTTNVLSGNFLTTKSSAPEFFRNDSFEVKLATDDTGYFPMLLGEENEAGCPVEGKLVNKDTE